MKPIKFTPIYKSAVWGGEYISRLKDVVLDRDDIGESWEISDIEGSKTRVSEGEFRGATLSELIERFGEELLGSDSIQRYGSRFPLLLKIIDAHHDLSVQVHPDEAMAAQRGLPSGKAEMWYVMQTRPDAKIYAGLAHEVDQDELVNSIASHTVMDHIVAYESKPGQVYYLPQGCIHTIGAGNLLVEIQQACDVTYRLYDYGRRDSTGRPRQLHVQEGLEAIKLHNLDKALIDVPCEKDADGHEMLLSCEFFTTKLINVEAEARIHASGRTFMILTAIEGSLEILVEGERSSLKCGETIFIPASIKELAIEGRGKLLQFTI